MEFLKRVALSAVTLLLNSTILWMFCLAGSSLKTWPEALKLEFFTIVLLLAIAETLDNFLTELKRQREERELL